MASRSFYALVAGVGPGTGRLIKSPLLHPSIPAYHFKVVPRL